MTTSFWIYTDFAVFFVALLLTGIIIPQILHIAFNRNLFDKVDKRKIHKTSVPRLGGIAFLPAIIFSVSLVLGVCISFNLTTFDDVFRSDGRPILYLLCAEMLMYIVGIADDLVGLRYTTKFAAQIICAAFICATGAYIHDLGGDIGINDIPAWIEWLVSGFIVVYLVNAINLIDGIDGLASGLSGIALLYYGILLLSAGQYEISLLAFAQLGTLVPFFYFNVFGNPQKRKKIFMGDTGALTLGITLAFISLSITNIDVDASGKHYNNLILAFSPLIIPIFDVVRVYFHRVRKHRNPFLPDKCHIHHKLLALGLGQRGALCSILVSAVIFMLVNVLLSPYVSLFLILIADIALWLATNILLTNAIRRREVATGTKLYD